MTERPSRLAVDRSFALVGLAVLIGAALAAVGLGRESVWVDESYTWLFVRLPWRDLLTSARIDAVNPPLYYILVKALVGSSALSEGALRLLSVLAHVAAIGGAAAIGDVVAGRTGRVVGAWLWALHPMTLWYARDARPYALAGALATLALACFLHAERGAPRRVWLLGGIAMAAGLVTHYFFFVLAATMVLASLATIRERPSFFRSWTLLTLVALVPLALWLTWFFQQGQPSLGIGWILRPTLGDLPLTLWNMLSGFGGRVDLWTTGWGLVLLILLGIALIPSTGSGARRYAFAGLVAPLLALWFISMRRPVFVDRYFLILLPWVVAIAASGGARAAVLVTGNHTSRWLWVGGAALAVGIVAGAQVHVAGKYLKEDWRGLARTLTAAGARPGDLVLSEPEIRLPLVYYRVVPSLSTPQDMVPACAESCWWILRQPYTVTHAFSQSVDDPHRPWLPDVPGGCSVNTKWQSPTGVQAWHLVCP